MENLKTTEGFADIALIKRAEYNPRIMPADEMAALKKSIQTWGFISPIVVNENPDRYGVLISGHQRITALEQLIAKGHVPPQVSKYSTEGKTMVPTIFVNLDLEQEKLLNIAMNKISGKWDEKKLAEIIIENKESAYIPATGFRDDEISRIIDGQFTELEDRRPERACSFTRLLGEEL